MGGEREGRKEKGERDGDNRKIEARETGERERLEWENERMMEVINKDERQSMETE